MKGYQTYDTQATVVKKRQENNESVLSSAGNNNANLSIAQKAMALNSEESVGVVPSLKRKLIGAATVHIDNFTSDGESPLKRPIKGRGGSQTV